MHQRYIVKVPGNKKGKKNNCQKVTIVAGELIAIGWTQIIAKEETIVDE